MSRSDAWQLGGVMIGTCLLLGASSLFAARSAKSASTREIKRKSRPDRAEGFCSFGPWLRIIMRQRWRSITVRPHYTAAMFEPHKRRITQISGTLLLWVMTGIVVVGCLSRRDLARNATADAQWFCYGATAR